jgi:hypothetical protein
VKDTSQDQGPAQGADLNAAPPPCFFCAIEGADGPDPDCARCRKRSAECASEPKQDIRAVAIGCRSKDSHYRKRNRQELQRRQAEHLAWRADFLRDQRLRGPRLRVRPRLPRQRGARPGIRRTHRRQRARAPGGDDGGLEPPRVRIYSAEIRRREWSCS